MAEERSVLAAELASSASALVSSGAHTQSICSDVGPPSSLSHLSWSLGARTAEGVATLPVLGLALFSPRENCLRKRMKLGARDVPEQHGPDRRWHT